MLVGTQVVAETYEELIFSEPSKKFYERVSLLEPDKAPRPELSVLHVVPRCEKGSTGLGFIYLFSDMT